MKFTLDELELLLRSLRTTIAALTVFNENTAELEKLAEDFAVEKGKMMRKNGWSQMYVEAVIKAVK